MKQGTKWLSALLSAAMLLSLIPAAFAAGGTAYASTQAVEVDGKKVEFQMYALKDASGNPTNYVKLRDVAHVLNGTKAQFAVGYDGSISVTTGTAYTDVGGEMTTPYSGDRAYREGSGAVKVDGQAASLESIVLTDDAGGDYTYFKLRGLGSALGFTVDWSAERGVIVETGGAAQPTEKTPLEQIQGIWYGRDNEYNYTGEVKIEGDQFLSIGFSEGVSYTSVAGTITSVEAESGEYRLNLSNVTNIRFGPDYYETDNLDISEFFFFYNHETFGTGTNMVHGMTRAASQQLYPQYQTALAASQSKPSTPNVSNGNGYYAAWPQVRDFSPFVGKDPYKVEEGGTTRYYYEFNNMEGTILTNYFGKLQADGFSLFNHYYTHNAEKTKDISRTFVYKNGKVFVTVELNYADIFNVYVRVSVFNDR